MHSLNCQCPFPSAKRLFNSHCSVYWQWSPLLCFCLLKARSTFISSSIVGWISLLSRPPGHIPVLLTPLIARLSETQNMQRIQPKTVFQPAVWSGVLTQQWEKHRIVRGCQGAGSFRQPPNTHVSVRFSSASELCVPCHGELSLPTKHPCHLFTNRNPEKTGSGKFCDSKGMTKRAVIVKQDASRTEAETRSFVVYGILLFTDFKKNSF